MKAWFTQGSWKTTSAGLLAIAGGLVRMAFAIKSGNVTEEAVMTTITTIVTGIGLLVARDNNVTSEQAGAAKPEPTISKSVLPMLLIGALCLSPLAVTGCKTTQTPAVTVAFRTLETTQILVDKAMKVYGGLCARGKVTVEKQKEIDDYHAIYRESFRMAVIAAQFNYGAVTPDNVQSIVNELIQSISKL